MRKAQQKLQHRISNLEKKNQDQELQLLKMQGEAEAATGGEVVKQADEEGDLKEKQFRGGQRALQALNPEISVVGDAFGKVILNEYLNAGEDDRAGFVFRIAGLHLQSDLDPFSFLNARWFRGRKLISYLGGWMKQALPLRGRKVVAYHKNWAYFIQVFGLESVASRVGAEPVIVGLAVGGEKQMKDIFSQFDVIIGRLVAGFRRAR